MISYAVSTGSFTGYMTPDLAAAFKGAKLRNLELSFTPYTEDNDAARESAELTRRLLQEGNARAASVHLPFYGNGRCWDPSCLDETERQAVARRIAELIRRHADLMAPLVTMHASIEPPMQEHPQRLDQACKTIEELLPLAQDMNFSINVEFLPRTCIGHNEEELETITSRFDPRYVGICLDVNHIMDRWKELPDIIARLAPRIRAFHINDYDGVDEMHWFPGQGVIDWPNVMKAIRTIDHDVLLILETINELGTKVSHVAKPDFGLKQAEKAIWFLENSEELTTRMRDFVIPGQD